MELVSYWLVICLVGLLVSYVASQLVGECLRGMIFILF